MDAFLASINPNLLTWGGLALLVVVSVMRGWLVPRGTHERMLKIQAESYEIVIAGLTDRNTEVVADKVERIEGSKVWEATATELLSQNRTMLEQQTTTVHALEGIRTGLVEGVRANRDVTQ